MISLIKIKKEVLIFFLLKQKKQDKLLILSLLSSKERTSEELSEILNRSRRYIKSMIRETNEDLKYYFNETDAIEIDSFGHIFMGNRCTEEILRIFYALKLVYLEETYEFKILHVLLENNPFSIEEIANGLFLSISYTRRLLKKMNLWLESFDFQIVDNQGICELAGNELSIRLFFYVLMNDTYHSLSWPYSEGMQKDTVNFQQSLQIILTILDFRKDKNQNVPIPNEKTKQLFNQLQRIFYLNSEEKIPHHNFECYLREVVSEEYFIFFGHIFAPHSIQKKEKLVLGEWFLCNEEKSSTFAIHLASKMIERFQIAYSHEKKMLLIYYFTMVECFCDIMDQTATHFEKLIYPPLQYSFCFENAKIADIHYFLESFLLEEKRKDLLENQVIKQYFSWLIYTVLQIESTPSIMIHLHCIKSLTSQDLIQTRIESIYQAQTIQFTSCVKKADLIITDCLNFDKETKKELFYFNTILEEEQWYLLLQKMNKLVLGIQDSE